MNFKPSIVDVSYFGIHDSQGRCYYSMNFEKIDHKELLRFFGKDTTCLYKERSLFVETKETVSGVQIFVVLLCNEKANELFVKNSMDNFIVAMEFFLEKWTTDKIESKYDLIVLLCNSFLFNGIIIEDDYQNMIKSIETRPFESINGIRVNKGLASTLNTAARNVKNIFH